MNIQQARRILQEFIEHVYVSFCSRKRLIPYLTVAAVVVSGTQAPPAILIPSDLQCQIPTATRRRSSFPLGPEHKQPF